MVIVNYVNIPECSQQSKFHSWLIDHLHPRREARRSIDRHCQWCISFKLQVTVSSNNNHLCFVFLHLTFPLFVGMSSFSNNTVHFMFAKNFLPFFDLHSISLTTTPILLFTSCPSTILSFSRSLLLPLSHCLLVLWCFNQWINDCFYFHSECLANTSCFVPLKELEIGFGSQREKKKRQKKKHAQRKVLQCLTRRTVTQEMNIFASLNSNWCVKRHRCTAHSPSSPPATTEHTPVNLTVAFNFIILHICSVFSFPHQCKWNTFLFGDFHRNVLFTRDIIRCTWLIIFCIPCPLNGMTTAAALLGLRDGHSERFDLA